MTANACPEPWRQANADPIVRAYRHGGFTTSNFDHRVDVQDP